MSGYPQTALGSPPPATRPDPEALCIVAYEALRSHPGITGLLGGAPLHDWFAAGGEIRATIREITDAIVAAMPQSPAPRAVIDALHDHCSDTIGSLEERYAEATAASDDLRAEVTRLTAIIDAARPHRPPAELAPDLWLAYAGRIRESGPPDLAEAIAPTWDVIADDDTGRLARQAFTDMAQAALEPVQADYDQAAEVLGLRAELAGLRAAAESLASSWRLSARNAPGHDQRVADMARKSAYLRCADELSAAIANDDPKETTE